jgi:hypothetical protein
MTNCIPCLLLLAACATSPATEGEADQPSIAPSSCDLRTYRCYPARTGADQACDIACGYPSHCVDYTPGESVWCEIHPGQCMGHGFRCCDQRGNPIWDTHCVDGERP